VKPFPPLKHGGSPRHLLAKLLCLLGQLKSLDLFLVLLSQAAAFSSFVSDNAQQGTDKNIGVLVWLDLFGRTLLKIIEKSL
jgi:hypothetical protein